MSGFITLERDTWDHPVLVRSEMSETEAWAWMIAQATWAGTTHMVGDKLVQVERGSFMITLRKLQSEFMWKSDKRVRNFLKKLENHGMLAVRTMGQRNARKTHVTICNYDKYQADGRSKDAAKTHGGRTADAVKKQGNKVTSKRDTNVSPKNGTRLPDDWFLSASLGQWSIEQGATAVLVRAEAEKFKDYWKGVAGAKGRKADWDATWRNWIRKAIADVQPKFKAITGGHNGQSTNKSEQRVSSFVSGAAGSS